jgi:hypothetical protein
MPNPLLPRLNVTALIWNLTDQVSYSSQHGTGDMHIQPILQDVIHCFLPSFFGVIHIPEVLVVRTTPAP